MVVGPEQALLESSCAFAAAATGRRFSRRRSSHRTGDAPKEVIVFGWFVPLAQVVRRSAGILAVPLDEDGADVIAARSRGTPRVANRLLRRVRDYAEVRGDGRATAEAAEAALTLFEVDELGLDKLDLAILSTVVRKFGGGPVGLSTLSAAVGEETETVEDVYEPYLLQLGLLKRTPRGRVATQAAYAHLGVAAPAEPARLL